MSEPLIVPEWLKDETRANFGAAAMSFRWSDFDCPTKDCHARLGVKNLQEWCWCCVRARYGARVDADA